MITQWFLDMGVGMAGWFLDLFPADFEVPDWFLGFTAIVNQIFSNAVGLGAWVPWPLVLLVVGFIFTVWGAGLLIKFVRWLIGLIPTMGGG